MSLCHDPDFYKMYADFSQEHPELVNRPDVEQKFLYSLCGGAYGRLSCHEDMISDLEKRVCKLEFLVRQLTAIIEAK